MSDTTTDMPKVCQMLDAGWRVDLFKNDMDSYTASATHPNIDRVLDIQEWEVRVVAEANGWTYEQAKHALARGPADEPCVDTDDFTPEQALTRLAYKVHREIL